MEKVLAMYQSGFGASASPNRGGTVHSGASKAPKMTTHRPTRCQVLILLDTPTAEVVVANAATVMNIEWNYSYYQPWSDNGWLVDEMIAIQEETLMAQNEDITMQ